MHNYLKNEGLFCRPVKLSQLQMPIFNPHRQYTPETKKLSSRKLSKTPNTRHHQFQSESRNIRSTHEKRLSSFLEKQISQLDHHRQQSHMSPVARDKINQLRQIMHLKSVSLRLSKYVEPSCCHFRQYKMSHEEINSSGSILLHSRNTHNSPLAKNDKSKRFISKSADSKRIPKSNNSDFKSIEANKQSKYAPIKKIILFGGSIKRQNNTASNPESDHLLTRNSKKTSRQNNFHHLREPRHTKKASYRENTQACMPWQTVRPDHPFDL